MSLVDPPGHDLVSRFKNRLGYERGWWRRMQDDDTLSMIVD